MAIDDVIIYAVMTEKSILLKSSKKELFGNRVFRLDRISKCKMRSLKVKFWKGSFEFKRKKNEDIRSI